MKDLVWPFLQYLLMLPAALFCALPLEKHFRYPLRQVYGTVIAGCTLIGILAVSAQRWGLSVHPSGLALATAGAGLALCRRVTDVKWHKLLNVFVNAVALLSFTGLASTVMESRLNPGGDPDTVTALETLAQWAMVAPLLAGTRPLLKKQYAWLVDEYDEENVWRVSWIIPALIAVCNVMMEPQDYHTMHVGRVFSVYLVLDGVLLCLLIFFNVVFYLMARRSVERAALEQRASILEIQAGQYAQLKAHMDQTAQQRHDFRHSIRVIDELSRQGKTEELRRYIGEYTAKLEDTAPRVYCANPALNALLAYYAAMAEESQVRVRLQIALPQALPVAEVDVCSLMGNLMENAIDACRSLPRERRYLALSAALEGGGRMYIVSTNAFDGNLILRGGSYQSTKHGGEGLGLQSVRAIAERYHGGMRIYQQEGSFCVDVFLKGEEVHC